MLHLFLASLSFPAARITVEAFPDSQDPFSAGPPTPPFHENLPACRIALFENVALDTYSTVSHFPYSPRKCAEENVSKHWDYVILKVKGRVKGVQYDRAGAIWIGGVELLRMTTPEPTKEGIHWNVERDVTVYASLFRQSSTVSVQIPNNVNNIYTGVIYLSAHLVFYTSIRNHQNKSSITSIADYVVGLANPPQHKDAWSSMAIRGTQGKTADVTLPFKDAARAHFDVYLSAHGCEEFWYTNPPDSIAKDYGMFGSGSAREIQISIDGRVAGVQPPFPVVYTGGINPLLWRPQTGIYSFNIPPYFFDITPFLTVLNDGKSHQIEVKIIGNSGEGEWNVDPVLVVFRNADPNINAEHQRMKDAIVEYYFLREGPTLVMKNLSTTHEAASPSSLAWVEEYHSELVVRATLNGKSTTINSSVYFSNSNKFIGNHRQLTSMDVNTSMSSSAYDRNSQMQYPLFVDSTFKNFNESFLIVAEIDYGVEHSVRAYGSDNAMPLTYTNWIQSHATYSRSNDANRTILIATGSSNQNYIVRTYGSRMYQAPNQCFTQSITADEGVVTDFHETMYSNSCLPEGFCALFDTCSSFSVNASGDRRIYAGLELLYRHPRTVFEHQERGTRFGVMVTFMN